MAKINYTNDDLLRSIKLGCMVPISQIALTDEDILFLASEELELGVLSALLNKREEYNVYVDLQDINTEGVYTLPSRASGSRFRAVFLKDNTGKLYQCSETTVTQVPLVQDDYNISSTNPMFYVQNDKIKFINNINNTVSASYVEIHYYMDPSELVSPDRCLTITSIDTDTGMLEVDERQIPSHIEVGAKIDFIQYKPQNIIKKVNATVVSVSSNTPVTSQKFITVDTDDLPDDLEVGDFIALAGESPVPQLVANMRPLLAQATVCRILESQGDKDNQATAQVKLKQLIEALPALIQDRTEGNPKKVVNRTGLMRASVIGRRNRGR